LRFTSLYFSTRSIYFIEGLSTIYATSKQISSILSSKGEYKMEWLFILGFALSSSIDNFGVGISYGVRKIRIRWLSNLLIAAIC
jgi:hypothetical protein